MTGQSQSQRQPERAPPGPHTIRLRVREAAQLYNSMDPSPFHERDLDPNAEQYILESAQDLPADAPLAILIDLDRPAGPDHQQIISTAIHAHFARLDQATGRQLRQLLRNGRSALVIGLSCVVASVIGGELILRSFGQGPATLVIRESLLIGGWVAMWRPLDIFLYDWWPIRNRQRTYRRLSQAGVQVVQGALGA